MIANTTWNVTPGAWSAFLERCPNATFFHTPEWYLAHEAAFRFQANCVHFRFKDGQEALMPMAITPRFRGLLRLARAGIENGYGGLVAPVSLTPAQVEAAYREVRACYPDLAVIGNPHEAFSQLPPSAPREGDSTQVLRILAPDEQRRRMNETRAKKVRRGAAAGFELSVFTELKASDAARFYGLYAERARQWGYRRWVRDESYFQALCHHAGRKLALFLAHKDGELAGFRMLGLHGPIVMDLFLGTAKAHEPQEVGPFLVAEPLAWCHERGYQAFDFLPSGSLAGVRAFKASFGAEELPHGWAMQEGLVGRSVRALVQLSRRHGAAAPAAG